MRQNLLLLLLIISQTIVGQSRKLNIVDTAAQFERQYKYDSAIYYWDKAANRHDDTLDIYWLFKCNVANCLFKQDNLNEAKAIYLNCMKRLDTLKVDYCFFSKKSPETIPWAFSNVCLQLSDIYNNESRFDSSIYFLNWDRRYFKEYYKHRTWQSGPINEYIKSLKVSYKYAQSFFGKQMIDTAINILTKYVFNTPSEEDTFTISTDYRTIVQFYFSLLKMKYCDTEIKQKLRNSEENIYYSYEFISKSNCYREVCYFIFLGNKVTFMDENYPAFIANPERRFSKSVALNDLQATYLYKLISNF